MHVGRRHVESSTLREAAWLTRIFWKLLLWCLNRAALILPHHAPSTPPSPSPSRNYSKHANRTGTALRRPYAARAYRWAQEELVGFLGSERPEIRSLGGPHFCAVRQARS